MKTFPLFLICCVLALWAIPSHALDAFWERKPGIEEYYEIFLGEKAWNDSLAELQKEIKKLAQSDSGVSRENKIDQVLKLAKYRIELASHLYQEEKRQWKIDQDKFFLGELVVEPNLNRDQSKAELLYAVNELRDVVGSGWKDPRRDEIYFLIATSLARTSSNQAETYFHQLINHAAKKELKYKAKLLFGDFLTEKNRNLEAKKAYSEIVNLLPFEEKIYAQYRINWLNLSDKFAEKGTKDPKIFLEFAAEIEKILLSIQEKKSKNPKFEEFIAGKVSKDLLWAWVLTDQAKKALSFLRERDQQDLKVFFSEIYTTAQIDRLGCSASSQALPFESADLPLSIFADLILYRGWACYREGNVEGVQEVKKNLALKAEDIKRSWFQQGQEIENAARIRKILTFMPYKGGSIFYELSKNQKNIAKNRSLLLSSIEELKEFLRDPSAAGYSVPARLLLAKRYLDAQMRPEALIELDFLFKKSELSQQDRKLVAFQRLETIIALDLKAPQPNLPPPGEVIAPIALSDFKKRFAEYATDYLHLFPDSEQSAALRYQIAQDLFLHGYYAQALPKFEDIVRDFPQSEQAKIAIEASLSMNLKLGRWAELRRLSASFLGNQAIKGKELRAYLKENLDFARSKLQ